jgi:predicted MPP superfamily phosphohydrolase
MKKRALWKAPAILTAFLMGLMAVAVAIGLREVQANPVLRRAKIAVPGWARGTPQITIALLSDIHLGNRGMDAARLERIVAQVNQTGPDLVLLAGDFVAGRAPTGAKNAEALVTPLAKLRPPLGAVAVLGNHDNWTAPDQVRSALGRAGVTVLENEALQRGPIVLVGIADAFSGHDQVNRAFAAARGLTGPRVVLTHSPDPASRLPANVPLLLAGHTHCGQVVFPWIGPLLSRSPRENWRQLYDRHYRCGLVRDPGRIVIVTAGVGSGTTPIRIGAPPDWWLIAIGPKL